jgi:hypothetical protein
MKCPHCSVGVSVYFEEIFAYPDGNHDKTGSGLDIAWDFCPECAGLLIRLRKGKYIKDGQYSGSLKTVEQEQIVYPPYSTRPVEPEVPERYRNDYLEASAILNISPKASAALSRRLLQHILREVFSISHRNLSVEIEEFIKQPDVPSYLSGAVDAIRNIGNFAAHPLKDTNSGEIVEVEPGEAEWLLEVLDSLFDFAFVQPVRLNERKEKLNEKLKALGKPAMKGK